MGRRAAFAFGAMAVGLAVWTACTGDDPTTTPTGAIGQPCNSDNSCNTGELQCGDGGFCAIKPGLLNDAAGTSSGSTTSSSGTSGSPQDAGPDAKKSTCLPTPIADGPSCHFASNGKSCPAGEACCTGANPVPTGQCKAGCFDNGGVEWRCELSGDKHCAGEEGLSCCVAGESDDPKNTDCSKNALVGARASCRTSCFGTERLACDVNGKCPDAGTCVKTEITTTQDDAVIIGLCKY